MEEKTYYIFVDGACTNNNLKDTTKRRAGYGIFLDDGKEVIPGCAESVPCEADVDRQLPEREKCFFISEKLAHSDLYPPTNNRAEILAAVRALELLLSNRFPIPLKAHVVFINDSKYVHSAVTDWLPRLWRPNNYCKSDGAEVLNVDLIRRLDSAVLRLDAEQSYRVEWRRVNSHQEEPKDRTSAAWKNWYGNDRADRLANLACGRNQFQSKKRKATEK